MGAAAPTQQLPSSLPLLLGEVSRVTVRANREVIPAGWGCFPAALAEPVPPRPKPSALGTLISGGIVRHLEMEKAAQGSPQTLLRPAGAAALDQTRRCWGLRQSSQLA